AALGAELVLVRVVAPAGLRPTGLQVIGAPHAYPVAYEDDREPDLARAQRNLADVAERLRGAVPVRSIRAELGAAASAIATAPPRGAGRGGGGGGPARVRMAPPRPRGPSRVVEGPTRRGAPPARARADPAGPPRSRPPACRRPPADGRGRAGGPGADRPGARP